MSNVFCLVIRYIQMDVNGECAVRCEMLYDVKFVRAMKNTTCHLKNYNQLEKIRSTVTGHSQALCTFCLMHSLSGSVQAVLSALEAR